MEERHSLTHHVTTHEGTVRIIVIEEGDQRSGDGADLHRRHVDQVDVIGIHDGEVRSVTALDLTIKERPIVTDIRGKLRHRHVLLRLGGVVPDAGVAEVYLAAIDLEVRRGEEAHVAHLGVDTERGDQTDIRTLRGLDRTETTVVGIVDVSHLKPCTITADTAGTESRETTLMRDLRQRIGLVHKLRQRVGPKEGIDHAADRLRINQINRGEDLIVPHIHTLADRTGYASETDAKLLIELLADGADATIAQVVDIVDIGTTILQLHQIVDDGDDILIGQDLRLLRDIDIQLVIDTVATDIAEVVPLVGEEEVIDHLLSRLLVHRVLAAELTIDMVDRLLLRVGGILLQRIGDDTIVETRVGLSLEEHRLGRILEIKDRLDILLCKLFISIDHYIVALHGDYFTRFLIHEILDPRIQDTCCYLTTDIFLQVGLIHLHLLGDTEETQNILIGLVADGSQQSSHGQLLLAIDVSVHDVINVCRKLDPRSLEGNDTGVEELGAVIVHTHGEEYSR